MRGIRLVENLPFNIPPIEDVTDKLVRHKTKVYQMRDPEQIDTITIHHMASEAPLWNQSSHHVNNKGWAALGYTLVVTGTGLHQCNDLLSQTNHSSGHNDHSVSIAILGDLSKRPMTSVERELLYAGILTLKHYLPSIKYIVGHNEQSNTACPCTSVNQIRKDIAVVEAQMQFEQSAARKKEMSYAIANQITYLYNLMQGKKPDGSPATAGESKWAENTLMELYPFMKERKLVK